MYRKKAFEGVKWNGISTLMHLLVSLAQLWIVVRLIEPEDFGLMAIVNVVLAFAVIFLDLGFSNGVIHKEEVSSTQLSSLYWLVIVVGFLLSVGLFFLSPLLARFYAEEDLTGLLRIVAIAFFVSSFGQQFRVLLQKELRFKQLAQIDLIRSFGVFVAVVYFAWRGFGVYALVIGYLVRVAIELVGLLWYGLALFRPRFIFKKAELQFFFRFGLFQLGERFLNYFNKNIDVLIIGKLLGTEVLGIYDVLKGLLVRPIHLINPIFTRVGFPLLSKIKEDQERVKQVYLRQLNYICLVNFPIYLFLFWFASAFVPYFFVADWASYSGIFQMLCLVYLLYSVGNPISSLLLAKGRADLSFYWNVAVFFIVPGMILLGVRWELWGVAIALLGIQIIVPYPFFRLLIRPFIRISFKKYLKEILKPLLIAGLAFGASFLLWNSIFSDQYLWLLLCGGITGGGIYLMLMQRFYPFLFEDLRQMVSHQ